MEIALTLKNKTDATTCAEFLVHQMSRWAGGVEITIRPLVQTSGPDMSETTFDDIRKETTEPPQSKLDLKGAKILATWINDVRSSIVHFNRLYRFLIEELSNVYPERVRWMSAPGIIIGREGRKFYLQRSNVSITQLNNTLCWTDGIRCFAQATNTRLRVDVVLPDGTKKLLIV